MISTALQSFVGRLEAPASSVARNTYRTHSGSQPASYLLVAEFLDLSQPEQFTVSGREQAQRCDDRGVFLPHLGQLVRMARFGGDGRIRPWSAPLSDPRPETGSGDRPEPCLERHRSSQLREVLDHGLDGFCCQVLGVRPWHAGDAEEPDQTGIAGREQGRNRFAFTFPRPFDSLDVGGPRQASRFVHTHLLPEYDGSQEPYGVGSLLPGGVSPP